MKYHIDITHTSKFYYLNAIDDVTNERIGKVCIDLDSEDVVRYKNVYDGKFAKIILISTSVNACGKGVATTLMNKTINTLNDYNLYLNVVPLKRNDKDKNKNQLIDFYKKFGFTKYDDDICVTTMIRKAS